MAPTPNCNATSREQTSQGRLSLLPEMEIAKSQAGAVVRLLQAASAGEEQEALSMLLQASCEQECTAPVLSFLLHESACFETEATLDSAAKTKAAGARSLQEELLLYFFVRRFAAVADPRAVLKEAVQPDLHWQWWTVQPTENLLRTLDSFHALLLATEWTAEGVSTLARVAKQLLEPRIRQHVLNCCFQLLQASVTAKSLRSALVPSASSSRTTVSPVTAADTKFFEECSRLLLLGVTDLWSAIRKDCAKAAIAIVLDFPSLQLVEGFMSSLLNVALGSLSVSSDKSQVTAWTEREGALLALSLLLRSIRMDIAPAVSSGSEKHQQSSVLDDIKGSLRASGCQRAVTYHFGTQSRHRSSALPCCLVQTLKPVMYQCLRHDQLSVRELSAQCLVNYVALCEEPMRLLVFQEVISKLNRIGDNERPNARPEETELVDAFEAEGLLDVLARAVPCLPPTFLVRHWKFVFPTLERYVMHIASTVRQKSSSVVLAMAKLSVVASKEDAGASSSATLELLVQMVLSLAKTHEEDTRSFCWQRREGRLLSIDVLVRLFGENLVNKVDTTSMAVQKHDVSWFERNQKDSPQEFLWAQSQVQTFNSGCKEDADSKSGSLWGAVSAWLKRNQGRNGLPVDAAAFWLQVIGGWISQTKSAFESAQFELRRISRQLLPGLMQLVIWTDQLYSVVSADLESAAVPSDWHWACAKYLLLHLRGLEEDQIASKSIPQLSATPEATSGLKSMKKAILAMEKNASIASYGSETLVEKVEVLVMAFLCFGGSRDTSQEVLTLLDTALDFTHAQLPLDFHLGLRRSIWTGENGESSLDRQLSISLVRILPAVVSTLRSAADLPQTRQLLPYSNEKMSERCDVSTAWRIRWLCLMRTIVAWLSSDDMFRWITVSKSEANSQLLESLRALIGIPQVVQLVAHETQEEGLLVSCLSTVFGKTLALKEPAYAALLEIYLQLWAQRAQGDDPHGLIRKVHELYSRRQQQCSVTTAEPKFVGSFAVESAAAWDDWDEEDDLGEVQQASPVNALDRSTDMLCSDCVFAKALQILEADKLTALLEALDTASGSSNDHELSFHIGKSMQQQIEACLRAR